MGELALMTCVACEDDLQVVEATTGVDFGRGSMLILSLLLLLLLLLPMLACGCNKGVAGGVGSMISTEMLLGAGGGGLTYHGLLKGVAGIFGGGGHPRWGLINYLWPPMAHFL